MCFKSVIAAVCLAALVWADSTIQTTDLVELYQIKIVNAKGGAISVSTSNGQAWAKIGEVKQPVTQTNPQGFTASKWGGWGAVVASAVNAIHIKIAQNTKDDKGTVFSILPSTQLDEGENNSYLNPGSSLYTSLPAGTQIFGGNWSPVVSNPVYLQRETLIPLPYNYEPRLGDVLVIRVVRPDPYPREIVFENRYGGEITIRFPGKRPQVAGTVLKPVQGVGRFVGTKYCGVGRVRANHNGVIDISTSPIGTIGGFQIIPAEHSESPEMAAAKTKTQWMIIGPANVESPGIEGLAPFFSGYIMPRYEPLAKHEKNWIQKIASRTLVQVQYKNSKTWEALPEIGLKEFGPLPESFNSALKDVTKIRILFPVF